MAGALSPDLVERASSGEAAAIEALLRITQPNIRRYALRTCRPAGEIAARLDTTRETVKPRLHRARGLLRDYLLKDA